MAGQAFDVTVQVLDPSAAAVPGANVFLSLGASPCPGASLTPIEAVAVTGPDGLAEFDNIRIDRGGYGFSVHASVSVVGTPGASGDSPAFFVEGFCATGSATVGRNQPTVTKLADGRVLVAGGSNGGTALNSAEIYNPSTGIFLATEGPMNWSRFDAQAVLLADGRVLIAGGTNGDVLSQAELFDPSTGSFDPVSSIMSSPRRSFQATRLADGRVLMTGGADNLGQALGTGDLYDPSTEGFTELPSPMLVPRKLHTATLLANGNVLLAGGVDAVGNNVGVIEEFVPLGGTFEFTGTLVQARNSHSANRLASGNVLIAGGNAPTVGTAATATAEVALPSGTSAATVSLNAARMSALSDGAAQTAGFWSRAAPPTRFRSSSAEVYTPTATGVFNYTGSLATPRERRLGRRAERRPGSRRRQLDVQQHRGALLSPSAAGDHDHVASDGLSKGTRIPRRRSRRSGTPPFTWTAAAPLPEGLQLSSEGVLAGIPTFSGAANVSVTVTGALGSVATASLPVFAVGPSSTNGPVTISSVHLEEGSSELVASPGAPISLFLNYTITDDLCPDCIDQIQIGFADATPTVCAYSGVPGPSPGVSGTASLALTVPAVPGRYYIAFDRAQGEGCPGRLVERPAGPDALHRRRRRH